MNCHLLIPGLLPPSQWIDAGLLRDIRLPALETLLARSQKKQLPAGGKEAWLCRTFGIAKQDDWPVAPYSLLADGGDPGSDFWLTTEPVHLQLQRNRMVLVDASNLEISAEEAASLTASLNIHFADNGITLYPSRPGRWHLRLAHPAKLETHPLDAVIGRDIRNSLPGGTDGGHWHRILNEIQMLLHDHPINAAREQCGTLPINSVWPWGGGVMPDKTTSPYVKVWAEDVLAIGLAVASNTPHAKPAKTATEWLIHTAPGKNLVILDGLRNAALHGDFLRWRENLLRLETDWIKPLLQALARGNISGLTLSVFTNEDAQTFYICRTNLWKIWRRGKQLNNFFEGYSS